MIGTGTGVRACLVCGTTEMRTGVAGLMALAQAVLRRRVARCWRAEANGGPAEAAALDEPLDRHWPKRRCRKQGFLPFLQAAGAGDLRGPGHKLGPCD